MHAAVEAMSIGTPIPKLDFMHTISRELTHKRRLENVYITSMDRHSDTEFLCGAFLPQANSYLNEMRTGPNDVTLTIIEIGRQLGIALCHAFMGVDRKNIFILNTLQLETFSAFHTNDWVEQDTLSVHATLTNRVYRKDGVLLRAAATLEFYSESEMVCCIKSDCTIQSIENGSRLREIGRARNLRKAVQYTEDPAPLEAIRIHPMLPVRRPLLKPDHLVVYDSKNFSVTLDVDLDNLFFFDHRNDHVPGMLILEGMRELAIDVAMRFPRPSTGHPLLARVDLGFSNFAEIDHPVILIAEVEDKFDIDGRKELYVRIEARQFNNPVSEGRFIIE